MTANVLFMGSNSSLVDEQQTQKDAYRLERMDNGRAITLAIFYSAAEAFAVLGCLVDGYRLMLGDRQVWPATGGQDDIAS